MVIIDLWGEIDFKVEWVFEGVYLEVMWYWIGLVIFNFVGVEYMNSIGIVLIVGLLV